uniref:Enoyl-CoA hydratase n=1 Tax=Ciona savignyi TaxID=51511 RepID=H2YAR8_CIOSA
MAHLTRFIIYEKLDGYAILRLARPERKNAFVQEMYGALSVYLKQAAHDDEVKVLVFTGTGEYFSSGADLIERDNLPNAEAQKKKSNYFREFVETMVKFPKPLIAAVNGPAIGIGVTCLPLCDVVYAAENATFMTPFTRIAIVPEACS